MLSKLQYFYFKLRRKRFLNGLYEASDPWSLEMVFPLVSAKIEVFLANRKYTNALDIGCGEGLYAKLLKKYSDGYLGIDVSAKAVARAASTTGLKFKKLDFDSVESLKIHFDLLVFNFVLDYLGFQKHPGLFAEALYRLLKSSTTNFASILILNPVYNNGDMLRFKKYLFLFENFGFKNTRQEIIDAGDFQLAVVLLQK